uniref:Carboxylesterase type B domain-containing protein n=2 Tax=Panagrolaimus sp. JU765 TaxID=591449 RepID=A0AC34PXD2_9BILA
MKKLYFFLILMNIFVRYFDGKIVVDTKFGSIEGFDFITKNGYETEVFLGIPYAKAPVGNLRFEKPQPPKPWSTTFPAKTLPAPCLTTMINKNGQEDCLYLNIVRPKIDSKNPEGYPVLFYIHGGAFLFGSLADSNYQNAANNLVSKEIIFVNIQYRLGIFGFFSTNDSTTPGNYGIYDQIQALKFVNEIIQDFALKFVNEIIQDFGGNPKEITICGESAGGASTSLLSMIDEADGLFARTISMSGSVETYWGLSQQSVKHSKMLANVVNCFGTSEEIKNCLKNLLAEKIIDGTKSFIKSIVMSDTVVELHFGPRIDEELIKNPVDFKEMFKRRTNKPTLIGLCSQEYILFATKYPGLDYNARYVPVSNFDAKYYNQRRFESTVKFLLSENNEYGIHEKQAIQDVINFYFSQLKNYNHNHYFQIFVQFMSDLTFNIPAMREAFDKKNSGHQVYFYVFDYTPRQSWLIDGVGHATDIAALFTDVNFGKVGQDFPDMIANFVKNGMPNFGESCKIQE